MRTKVFVLSMLATLNFAFASTERGNGGDGIAQEFNLRGREVLELAQRYPETFEKYRDQLGSLESTIATTKTISQEQVWLDSQELDAKNYPSKKEILINRKRWMEAAKQPDGRTRQMRIALHEYLWIQGLDDTNYVVSNAILSDLNSEIEKSASPGALTALNSVVMSDKSDTGRVVLHPEKTDVVFVEGTSRYNRLNKEYTALAQLAGRGPFYGNAHGLALGKFLDTNTVLSLEWVASSGGEVINFASAKQWAVGVHLKRFMGNSFYVKGGLDYFQVDFKYERNPGPTDAYSSRGRFDAEVLSAGLVIGNQWQWEMFTLGVDWVGLSLPVWSQVRNAQESKGSLAAYAVNFEDEKRVYATGGALHLGRVYMGVTF